MNSMVLSIGIIDMEIAIFIFQCIGGLICLLSGVALTALLTGLVTNYFWRKMRNVHSLVEIQRAVRAYKKHQKD